MNRFYRWLFDHSGGTWGRIAACGIIGACVVASAVWNYHSTKPYAQQLGAAGGGLGITIGVLLTLKDRADAIKAASGKPGSSRLAGCLFALVILAISVGIVLVIMQIMGKK